MLWLYEFKQLEDENEKTTIQNYNIVFLNIWYETDSTSTKSWFL